MGTQLSEPVKEAMVNIHKYLKANQPYIFILEKEIKKLDSGMLSVTMRVFNGKVQDIVVHEKVKRYKVNYGEEKQGASQHE